MGCAAQGRRGRARQSQWRLWSLRTVSCDVFDTSAQRALSFERVNRLSTADGDAIGDLPRGPCVCVSAAAGARGPRGACAAPVCGVREIDLPSGRWSRMLLHTLHVLKELHITKTNAAHLRSHQRFVSQHDGAPLSHWRTRGP